MMTRKAALAVVVAGLVAIGCQNVAPTAPEGPQLSPVIAAGEASSPVSSLGANSGCYAVSGEIDGVSVSLSELKGTVSGDIVGTFVSIASPPDPRGGALFRTGTQTWEIDPGTTIEELVGETLTIEVELVGQTQKVPVVRYSMKGRVVGGADKGNLTFHGFFNLGESPPTTKADYRGVICP